MSKELEALERLKTAPSFMGGTVEYQACTQSEALLMQDYEIVKQALQRLESIDNAEPSEALECLELMGGVYLLWGHETVAEGFKEEINTIKQALLKAQEPKHYLKWEDLEFNHTPKMIDVKMSGNKYKLVVGYNVAGYNLAILRNDKNQYYFLEADKQFFNDLRLERVEE